MTVNSAVVARHVAERLPEMATEELLMAAVAKGGDRQTIHEKIRQHAHAAAAELKCGEKDTLVARLQSDPAFAGVNISASLDPTRQVGRAAQQVGEFLTTMVTPIRQKFYRLLNQSPTSPSSDRPRYLPDTSTHLSFQQAWVIYDSCNEFMLWA